MIPGWFEERAEKYREYFELETEAPIIPAHARQPVVKPMQAMALKRFNIEWHFIPSAVDLPFDNAYLAKLYPTAPRLLTAKRESDERSLRNVLSKGHAHQQGYVVGIETTQKPGYLPRNRQFYGTKFGHDLATDPLTPYFGAVGMANGTRFEQNYPTLRKLFNFLNDDWNKRNLLPAGYRVTVCPPAIFNLIGTVFYPQWSETESLELGFYRDERGNATCFAVGANSFGDFSYIDVIDSEEWALAGFRIALLPEQTKFDSKYDEQINWTNLKN